MERQKGATGPRVAPDRGIFELMADQADVLALLIQRVLADEVVRPAARPVATDGAGTLWDEVPVPPMHAGGSS